MPKPTRSRHNFSGTWWKQYGQPVAGPGEEPDAHYWGKFGLGLLGLKSAEAVGMLLAMVLDADRNRSRRALEALRTYYKKTYPALAEQWGRPRPGHTPSLSKKAYLDIALAQYYGIKKLDTLKTMGRVGEGADSSMHTSQYKLLDRAVVIGRELLGYSKEIARLDSEKPERRKKILLSRLKRHSTHSTPGPQYES